MDTVELTIWQSNASPKTFVCLVLKKLKVGKSLNKETAEYAKQIIIFDFLDSSLWNQKEKHQNHKQCSDLHKKSYLKIHDMFQNFRAVEWGMSLLFKIRCLWLKFLVKAVRFTLY
jgi:hypothetical protein